MEAENQMICWQESTRNASTEEGPGRGKERGLGSYQEGASPMVAIVATVGVVLLGAEVVCDKHQVYIW